MPLDYSGGFSTGSTSLPGFVDASRGIKGQGVGNYLPNLALSAAGTALAPATGGASLLASPILQMILGQAGGNFLASLLGGGQTGFEGATQQSLGARQQLIGNLQQQAAGQPSAASRGLDLQIGQAQNRLQQSFGASAQRGGTAGTTVARAQQGRLQAAGLQAKTIAQGQLQSSAQQQLAGLTGRAPEQQFLAEAQRRQYRKEFLGGFAGLVTKARRQDQEGLLDPRMTQILDVLTALATGNNKSLVNNTQSFSTPG